MESKKEEKLLGRKTDSQRTSQLKDKEQEYYSINRGETYRITVIEANKGESFKEGGGQHCKNF